MANLSEQNLRLQLRDNDSNLRIRVNVYPHVFAGPAIPIHME